ncbi:MAG: serine/threonine protein phosphatase [Gemmataceae bacterium]|nr:serine/threonine protein phosphatase [Gemmataceae bacterium]
MRVLAIGDIHGCLRAFDLLLDMAQPTKGDLLVTLGDYIDRGPDSAGTLHRLIGLRKRCKHIVILGNHDIMMLQSRRDRGAFDNWFACGGEETLQSYGADLRWNLFQDSVPTRHWNFLQNRSVPYFEIDTHFFVHANVFPEMPLQEQPEFMLYWECFDADLSRPHESGKVMVCGHTAQKTGAPLAVPHAICIDTWVYGNGWLTCLDVRTGKYWQAKQTGEQREGWLQPDEMVQ